jgi:hypothetical protein
MKDKLWPLVLAGALGLLLWFAIWSAVWWWFPDF